MSMRDVRKGLRTKLADLDDKIAKLQAERDQVAAAYEALTGVPNGGKGKGKPKQRKARAWKPEDLSEKERATYDALVQFNRTMDDFATTENLRKFMKEKGLTAGVLAARLGSLRAKGLVHSEKVEGAPGRTLHWLAQF